MHIYHVVPEGLWESFRGSAYETENLDAEGFIHCSFAEQINEVLKRYYSDAKRVMIIEIDPSKLRSKLVVESSTGGENYPHVYGPINIDAVVGVQKREIAE